MLSSSTSRSLRLALASTALVAAGLGTAACDSDDTSSSAASSAPASTPEEEGADDGADNGGDGGSESESDDGGSDDGGSDSSDSGGAKNVGQACGANDLRLSAALAKQEGTGYIILTAQANSGITCSLDIPPGVAFGSDGNEVPTVDGMAGQRIELSGDKKAYAGIRPNATDSEDGEKTHTIVVSTMEGDANPATVDVHDSFLVNSPKTTGWYTSSVDAVPPGGKD